MKLTIYRLLLLVLGLTLSACNLSMAQPTPTATVTHTPSHTPSVTPSLTPSVTFTPSATPSATWTPSATPSPTISPTPSITPTPSLTPQPAVGFVFDNWELIELPAELRNGVNRPYVVFTNTNDQENIANIATAEPGTNREIVYFASPTNSARRLPVLELTAGTGDQVYLSPAGNALAYYREAGLSSGLYLLNLSGSSAGLSARIVPTQSLVQRGFRSEPQWEPNGQRLALALATGYDMDIFLYARDGSGRRVLMDSGAYEWWPRWSPDGTYLAYVSDRDTCPSWRPGEANACDARTADAPIGGQVYVVAIETGTVIPLRAEGLVTEPPEWVNDDLLSFATTNPDDLLNPQRRLWLADASAGTVSEARPPGEAANVSYYSATWKPDGSAVFTQRATLSETELILLATDGTLLDRITRLNFARFGMAAAWSPDGERLTIGGVDGACPYGIQVTDENLDFIATGSPPPSMCDPVFARDGSRVAFTGVNPRVDGRVDVYTANQNGFDAINLTADLRGSIRLIGWIGD